MLSTDSTNNMGYNKDYIYAEVKKNPNKYPNARRIFENPKEFMFDLREFSKSLPPEELDTFESNFVNINQELSERTIEYKESGKFAQCWENFAAKVHSKPSILAENKIKIYKDSVANPVEYVTPRFVLSGKARFYDKFLNFQDRAGIEIADKVKAEFGILREQITARTISDLEAKNIGRRLITLCEIIKLK